MSFWQRELERNSPMDWVLIVCGFSLIGALAVGSIMLGQMLGDLMDPYTGECQCKCASEEP